MSTAQPDAARPSAVGTAVDEARTAPVHASLLVAARAYAARGWSIIPIKHCPGPNGAKKPAVPWKAWQRRRPTPATLKRWFGRKDLHGLAVICGAVSGNLACRDFDDRAAYRAWADQHPDLAQSLPTVQTGRGTHVYYRWPGSRLRPFDDGEARGEGAYVLLPPSLHPRGCLYRWVVPLPKGELPIIDPAAAGLLSNEGHATESTESTEKTEKTEEDGENRGNRVGVVANASDHPSIFSARAKTPALPAEELDALIRGTLPAGNRKRHRAVFAFARALKGRAEFADADPRSLRAVVQQWHEHARPVIVTKPFEESWIDFLRGWPRVKYPAGAGPMDVILERARRAEPAPEALGYEQPALRLLVSVCRELARASGDGVFYLACRTAGRLVGVDHTTAARWLFLMTADSILSEVEKGGQGHNPRRATRYRFVAQARPPPVATAPAVPDGPADGTVAVRAALVQCGVRGDNLRLLAGVCTCVEISSEWRGLGADGKVRNRTAVLERRLKLLHGLDPPARPSLAPGFDEAVRELERLRRNRTGSASRRQG